MAQTSQIFNGGLPTGPDVLAIRRALSKKENTPGELILYEDIERILGDKRGSPRFITVTTQWRRAVERDSGFVVGCERNLGFRILDASGKLQLAKDKMRMGVRCIKRSVVVSSQIDRQSLTEVEIQQLDRLERRQAGIMAAAQIRTTVQLPSLTE